MQGTDQRSDFEIRQQDLVRRTLEGDQEAFAGLVEAYQTAVFNLCYRMLGQAYDAEDAAQEAFARAYRQLATYEPSRPFKTWLFAIACHECIDQLRKRRVVWLGIDEPPLMRHPALRESAVGPEDNAIMNEQRTAMEGLLARLSPRDRSMIVMRYWEDLSYQEIAEATGDSVDAVKSRLHRARVTLATLLRSRTRGQDVVGPRPVAQRRPSRRPTQAQRGAASIVATG